jgi:hypothetical protein
MILCQNCLHKEILGAMFCSECGAQLIYAKGVPTSVVRMTTSKLWAKQLETKSAPVPVVNTDNLISLSIISSGDCLPLSGNSEVTLGRISEGQPARPDIDLTPYKAYEGGVSRMHASIRVVDDLVMVTDLGSANGTRVNGMQITPHIPCPLKHGDIVTLGKFKIQLLLRNR